KSPAASHCHDVCMARLSQSMWQRETKSFGLGFSEKRVAFQRILNVVFCKARCFAANSACGFLQSALHCSEP
ncbi:MAG TPA: hypothetical protein PLO51_05575, partial [Candidatus Micrarchaeota archaeon]|nr:hypothetical protein [Candidatus Micrarchaeota archaeon]